MFQPNAKTKLFLLLGNPVGHSMSPIIHNTAFKSLGLNSVYLACPVEEFRLQHAVEGLKALSIGGANITSPYKEAVIPFLEEISHEARLVQSVNTIVNRKGTLYGTTTDGEGLYMALKQVKPDFKPEGKVVIIGAGGAARAAAYTLAQKGAGKMTIVNRSLEKGQQLAELLRNHTGTKYSESLPLQKEYLVDVLQECRLIVYSLPVDDQSFLDALAKAAPFKQNQILLDLRYSPEKSMVMEAFEKYNGQVLNGLGMLTCQAALSFEHFTGLNAPLEVMQKAAGFMP